MSKLDLDYHLDLDFEMDTTEDFDPLYDQDNPYYKSRYKVWYGGRGARKSREIVQAALWRGMQSPLFILCTRELQKSIKDSIHRSIKLRIKEFGLGDFYTVLRDSIVGINGTEFIFKGLRANAEEIKSTEGVDICLIEEAQKVSDESWSYLIPTIRDAGSELWIAFNPDLEDDPTYQRFIIKTPPNAYIRKVNWSDNPQFTDELEAERLHLKRVDPEAYDWIWNGNPRKRSEAEVLIGKWIVDTFDPGENWDGPYFGADFGFSTDPATLMVCWVHDGRLWIEYEAYKVGVEVVDYPSFYDQVPGSRIYTIRADSSRPELISHIRNAGFKIVPADKWAGSIEDGISHLRGYEQIVIHPRCVHAEAEAKLWKYKTDRLTGDVLPDLADGNEHTWDGVRYGLSVLIKAARGGVGAYQVAGL